MTPSIQDQNLQKQIGCMSGFLHIFDRQQILTGKRIHSTKRLPPSTGITPEVENPVVTSSPAKNSKFFPTSTPPRSPLPLPVFETKNSLKFCKEMPRLSLDSRATVDSKGSLCVTNSINGSFEKQQRSPSVIARLMGLDRLPSSDSPSPSPELRRSASESRVSGDLFQTEKQNQTNRQSQSVVANQNGRIMEQIKLKHKSEFPKTSQLRYPQQRRSFFDSADFFPEPKQTTAKNLNLKLRRADEQSKDLEALKHILDAMQLKGLLHSINRDSHRNFVYDSNQILMNRQRSPRKERERGVFNWSGRSPVRSRNSPINTNDKRKALTIETSESQRNSPKLTPKRTGSEHHSVVTNRSPRSKRQPEKIYSKPKVSRTVVAEDESSSVSESSRSTTERSKTEEYRDGRSLLERCDKLLAEMNNITESHSSSNSVLPSPVSVLDSAFDKDESSSPSPVLKRTIDFKDHTVDLEDDDIWSSIITLATSTEDDEFISGDCDFTYISKILRASKYLPDESSVFYFLEKQQHANGNNDSSTDSKLQRKLVFDVVTEILHRNRNLPPWNSISLTESNNSVKHICFEYQKIREPKTAENLLDPICTVLKRDLAGKTGWGDHPVEVSEAVLYIERLIFKDLVSETIGDLANFPGKTAFFAPRRKLVF